ncbi:MAG TPA: tricarballylate utilization 4Fe-4S protein TcuB [Vicinamibacterales bacterium]|nr:tricarballylate utilization 4Fe-4S protein TcuB [Vicinamibacterales bacterium]
MSSDALARGEHVMTVCNACRYCEAYCPVFQAMETRTSFAKGDVLYLANLCHNCGECLYACQYAPPHEFDINVPRVLAEARLVSYEAWCWPAFMRGAYRRSGIATSLALSVAAMLALWLAARSTHVVADFYAVIPHDVMVGVFGAAGVFAALALGLGFVSATRAFGGPERPALQSGPSKPTLSGSAPAQALRDVLTLRHLHATGDDCTSDIEVRTPWRRWFHHCTFYGFALCFASTTVAAVYHVVFGWRAPYAMTSAPVLLGAVGGAGLVVGPIGLLMQRHGRDPALGDPAQQGLDTSFIVMLLMTSVTGLLLLALRAQPVMPALLVVHLGFVLALFLTLPYGKFVHGVYRTAALLKFAAETR